MKKNQHSPQVDVNDVVKFTDLDIHVLEGHHESYYRQYLAMRDRLKRYLDKARR